MGGILHLNFRSFLLLALAFVIGLSIIFTAAEILKASDRVPSDWPQLQIHPLPLSLARWQSRSTTQDYFSEVKSTPVGYLLWSKFPVRVYVDRPVETEKVSASTRQFWQWTEAVCQAVKEWNAYLPLVEVRQARLADIVIERSRPPIVAKLDPETGLYDISRARTAQTRYELYLTSENPPVLSHRTVVRIGPGRGRESIEATARHELGHALGIWGHSPDPADAMYFAGVADSPFISERDINTLKKIYQQPTRLGWAFPKQN